MSRAVFKYKAIRFRQTLNSEWLVSFAASAMDIDKWGGIPEKRNFDSVESTGFQRTFKDDRLKSLVSFFSNSENVLQNPLLCAPRNINTGDSFINFVIDSDSEADDLVQKGTIEVTCEDYNLLSLLDVLTKFKDYLETREPSLRTCEVDQKILSNMRDRIDEVPTETIESDEELLPDQNDYSNNIDSDTIEIDKSHIYELWQEIKARIIILSDLPNLSNQNSILDFSKDSIISYLKPIIIVDGQHRLKGALEHVKQVLEQDDILIEIEQEKSKLEDQSIALDKIYKKYSRQLPISLIMSADPAEHVFQFVVVNQKATPINNALLGTIVSTTLSSQELERVAQRLKDADIPLEASHAVSFVTRHSDSPFVGLVQTGISGEVAGKLPWSVMKSLVSMFKDLKGGRFFSDVDKVDYADLWKRRYLIDSPICNTDASDAFTVWSDDNGVWKDVFINFWKQVRDKFGNTTAPNSYNYWGNTSSNLFNKVSLTILAVDFFKFLCDTRTKLDSADQIFKLVDEWLEGVDPQYFNRDWYLSNIRKDSPGIRKQWNKLWLNYRPDPKRLPSQTQYKINFS